jgi:hypothetical protein
VSFSGSDLTSGSFAGAIQTGYNNGYLYYLGFTNNDGTLVGVTITSSLSSRRADNSINYNVVVTPSSNPSLANLITSALSQAGELSNGNSANLASLTAALTLSLSGTGASTPTTTGATAVACTGGACGSTSGSSGESCDKTCVAAIILLPLMAIFFIVCAILSFAAPGCFDNEDDMPLPGKKEQEVTMGNV